MFTMENINLNKLCLSWVLKQEGKWGLHMGWSLPRPPENCDASGMSVPKPLLKSWPAWYVGMASKEVWGPKKFGAVEAERLCIEEREASLTGRMGFHLEDWSMVKWGPDVEAMSPFPVLTVGSSRGLVLDQWSCTIQVLPHVLAVEAGHHSRERHLTILPGV